MSLVFFSRKFSPPQILSSYILDVTWIWTKNDSSLSNKKYNKFLREFDYEKQESKQRAEQ